MRALKTVLFACCVLWAVSTPRNAQAISCSTSCYFPDSCAGWDCLLTRDVFVSPLVSDIMDLLISEITSTQFNRNRNWFVGRSQDLATSDEFTWIISGLDGGDSHRYGRDEGPYETWRLNMLEDSHYSRHRQSRDQATFNSLINQMTATAFMQTYFLGTLFDSKLHLEGQLELQKLTHEAHRDYVPSTSFCTIGTSVRNLAQAEHHGESQKMALTRLQSARLLRRSGMSSAAGRVADKQARWHNFINRYCDPFDNNWLGRPATGMMLACNNNGTVGATSPDRINLDVNYTKLIEANKTIEINELNGNTPPSVDFQDILALSTNLYGHNVFDASLTRKMMQNSNFQELYLKLRSLYTKRDVALNSFNSIVALKTSSPLNSATPFLNAILLDLGMSREEIENTAHQNPSYYAQLEILSQKLFQNPDFYTQLYDTPANLERKEAALRAIDLLLERAIQESEERQEMLLSVMLSNDNEKKIDVLRKRLQQ